MKCLLKHTQEVLADEVEVADMFFTRLKGLMFRRGLAEGKALLLDPCPQIHTCFMRFPIDAVFCDKTGKVLYVKENMVPWRFGRFVRGSRYTLEFTAGVLRGRVKEKDEIVLQDK